MATVAAVEADTHRAASPRLVLIEDSPSDLMLLEVMLAERLGARFEHSCARTLEQGLDAIDAMEPTCVLLDLGLPDSEGVETIDAVVRHAPDIPVVIVTGLTDDRAGELALSHGAQDYLIKHRMDADVLVRTIRYATERKAADLAARRSDAWLRSLIDLVPDAIIACSMDLTVTFWNRGAEEMYGWTAAEAVGRRIEDLIGTTGGETQGLPADTVATGRGHGELLNRRKDGQLLWVDSRWTALANDDDTAAGFMGANRDVTWRHDVEDRLAQSNAELEQFAYVASHDLNEPLRTVAGFVQLLGRRYEGRLDAEADEYIQFTLTGVRRMQTLIKDLLDYSRVSRLEYVLKDVDVEAVVHEVVDDAAGRAFVEVGPMPTVRADAGQLRRMFQNLLANSLKFAHPEREPRIRISARRRPSEWRFTVEDNGIGIPADQREHIFEMFKRLHSQDEYPGTGIGLSVCRRVIERHGGRIWVESVEGERTAVHFTLPAREVRPTNHDDAGRRETSSAPVGEGRG